MHELKQFLKKGWYFLQRYIASGDSTGQTITMDEVDIHILIPNCSNKNQQKPKTKNQKTPQEHKNTNHVESTKNRGDIEALITDIILPDENYTHAVVIP